MKKALQKKLYALFLLITLCFTTNRTLASHAVASDLTYRCLGNNTFEITLTFYRDCAGIPAPNNPVISIKSASCGQNLTLTLTAIPGTGQEITPVCSSTVTTCHGGTFTGIQQWIYTGIITLPMQCTDWTFSYLLCCRNAAITTISNPGTSTIYIYATLNNVLAPCNNSPVFSNMPVPFLCVGQPFCYSQGATDADGDSMSYQLITPLQTATTTINYLAGYTATEPLNSSPAVVFDSTTGEICMTPQQLQVTVMAVLVNDYRNGVLIGSVERDMQVFVMNCNNNLPWLSGINGTNVFNMTVCAGTPFCFNILSNDIDTGQTLTVTWNSGIAGATFNTAGNPHPTATFCWTPPDSLISTSPYCFSATVKDNACPYNGSQVFTYCITVDGLNVNLGPDQQISCTDLATIYATVNSPDPVTYLWSTGATSTYITAPVGTYWCSVTDGTCTATDTIVITSPYKPVAAFTNTTPNCLNDTVVFTDQSTSFASTIISWTWNFGDGSAVSNLKNPVHIYPGTGTYIAQLLVMNNLGCLDSTTDTITILPPPTPAFTWVNACQGQSVSFTDQSTDSATSWNWNFGDGQTSTTQNPTHIYSSSGSYTVKLIVKNVIGCSSTISHTITAFPKPTANFTAPAVCIGNSTAFSNTSTGGTTSWHWNFGNGDTSIVQNPTYTYGSSGTYNVTLIVTTGNGCMDTVTKPVKVNPLPVANAGPDITICNGSTGILVASGGVTYSWTPSGVSNDTAMVNPTVNTTYTVTVTDVNGCSASDTTSVTVNPLPVANAGSDISICKGSSGTLTASGGGTYQWSPTGNTTASITISPVVTTAYTVIVKDANGCTASDNAMVTVHNPPVISLSNAVLCIGDSIQLNAGAAGSNYAWSTGATTQTITVTSAGGYSVTVTDANGCTATASNTITAGVPLTVSLSNISICQGQTATLDAGNAGSTYIWSSGQTIQNINVNTAGTYSVTVTNGGGCTGSSTATVAVNPLPQISFLSTTGCAGDTTIFTNTSSIISGTIAAYSWNFGNGNSSTLQNPNIVYAGSGSYNVTLTATSAAGCTNSIVHTVTVNPLPAAAFTAASQCLSKSVHFHDNSTVPSGNIINWNWNFGDSNSSVSQNPTYQYSSAGTYNVTLTVTTVAGCTQSITKPVTIYPLPVASFSAATVCSNMPMTFVDASSIFAGSITSYSWSFGDGGASTLSSPNYTYGSAGSYNVSLIVTSSNGCKDTVIQPVTVNPVPVASAGVNQSICTGNSAILSATGGGSYLWNTGSTNPSITVNPVANTAYTATVTNASGCTASATLTVTVNALPVANAGPDKDICVGANANLTASGGSSYLWNNGATTATITVNPASTTSYNVTVTNGNGCQASDTAMVNVNPLPTANAGPDQTICQGSTATLTGSGGSSYQWNPVGSFNQTINVNPAANTTYYLTVTNAFGCTASDSVNIVVNPIPSISLSSPVICSGVSATLDAGNPGSTYIWAPTGETTQTISVSSGGTYSVTVTNAFGCFVNGQTIVTTGGSVSSNPTANTICQGQSTTLDAGNPGYSYLWSTGDITQTITVTTAGTYSVTVTNPSGCSAIIINTVNENPSPVVSFLSPSNCANNLIQFTDESSISTGNLISWSWNFGDGQTSNQQNPQHNYSSGGAYNVTLNVSSDNGCSSASIQTVTVNPLPTANFRTVAVCDGDTSSFTDLSSISSGNISSWNWTFGDGQTSASQSPQHKYAQPGNYNTTLIVASNNGCLDTISLPASVNPLPVPMFSVPDACSGTSTAFNNTSTINNGTIATYSWNFGDGTTSSSPQTTHQYSVSGSYNVTLTATSAMGCSQSMNGTVNVITAPTASFTLQNICQGSAINFTDHSTANAGSITSWSWNFNDGTSSAVTSPNHLYTTAGKYNVQLAVTSSNGCTDTVTNPAVIYPQPAVDFTFTNVCQNNQNMFNNISTISTGTIVSYFWTFGDGSTSLSGNPQHVYSTANTYNVVLIAASNHGCIDTISHNVNVFPAPTADFSGADVCLSSSTQFNNQTTVPGGGVFTSLWNFGDTGTSNALNPTHTFSSGGTYIITLTATSANGCMDSVTKQVNVYLPPTASFVAKNNCFGIPTELNDSSKSSSGTIVDWEWNFGDSSSSVKSKNAIHTYSYIGRYNVSLAVTTDHGCRNSANNMLAIYPLPSPAVSAPGICEGVPVSLVNSGDTSSISTVISSQWNFGDGSISDSLNATHIYTGSGKFNITLQTTNQYGCTKSVLNSVEVYPKPKTGFSATNECMGAPVNFANNSTISSGSIASYNWNFGDNLGYSTLANPAYSYPMAGTFSVTLNAISDHGCARTMQDTITIYSVPVVVVNGLAKGCSPLNALLTDSSKINSGHIVGWLWNFGDGDVSTDQNPQHLYTRPGNYIVTLTVSSDKGCVATGQGTEYMEVLTSAKADFTMNPTTIDMLNPVVNFTNLSTNYDSLLWDFGDGSTSHIISPSHLYKAAGDYTIVLTVNNNNNCPDVAMRKTDINPHSTLFAPNAFTPNADGKNDVWKPEYNEMTDIKVWIFNRWGEMLTYWEGLDGYWDGVYKGRLVQEDVYVYQIEGTGADGKFYKWTGDITLVR